jgi:HEAT repeat protein
MRAIDAFLASPPARAALRNGLRSGAPDVRRQCVVIAARAHDVGVVELLTGATRDPDPAVARRATDALASRIQGDALHEVLVPLVRSTSAAVRLRALVAMCADGPADVSSLLFDALLDASGAIRELARYELRQRGHEDVRAVYAKALAASEGRRLLAAVSGLGECGNEEHAPLVVPFLAHVRGRVRAAAAKALVRLAPEASVPRFFDALRDPSARVVRTAYEALRGKAHLLDRAALLSLLDGAPSVQTRCAALGLLCEGDLWSAMGLALYAVLNESLAVREAAVAHLERLLLQQTYARPSDLGALESSLRAAEGALPPVLCRRIAGALAAVRKMR